MPPRATSWPASPPPPAATSPRRSTPSSITRASPGCRPALRCGAQGDSGGLAGPVAARRASTGDRAGVWQIPVCTRWSTKGKEQSRCMLLDGPRAEVTLEERSCPDWVLPNAGYAGYYHLQLDTGRATRLVRAGPAGRRPRRSDSSVTPGPGARRRDAPLRGAAAGRPVRRGAGARTCSRRQSSWPRCARTSCPGDSVRPTPPGSDGSSAPTRGRSGSGPGPRRTRRRSSPAPSYRLRRPAGGGSAAHRRVTHAGRILAVPPAGGRPGDGLPGADDRTAARSVVAICTRRWSSGWTAPPIVDTRDWLLGGWPAPGCPSCWTRTRRSPPRDGSNPREISRLLTGGQSGHGEHAARLDHRTGADLAGIDRSWDTLTWRSCPAGADPLLRRWPRSRAARTSGRTRSESSGRG